ncbi:oligosaccharide flippase family protein [Rosenbergiella epipactidis]|uniref:oligosaccharide flippase family protein n=1 Tax=Rosenbergiella epipactidis TaxID=1544694 RepID=UPI001F4F0CE0|nr:polysaccharide biosynthesis C-terminal domain-containing protein [Rosenbergiella epipactidis]
MNLFKQRFFSNSVWIIFEKLINIFGLIFVTSGVAKYIGPDNFGKLNIALYFFSIFQVIAIWGSDTIGIKLIAKFPKRGYKFLKQFLSFKIFSFIIIASAINLYFYYEYDSLTMVYSLAVTLSSFIYVVDNFVIYNEANLNSKYNVVTNVIGLFFALVTRFYISHNELNPVLLSIPIIIQSLVPFIIRAFIFRRSSAVSSICSEYLSFRFLRYGLYSGFGLLISSLSILVYINVSRVFVSKFTDLQSLGIYSVAITLGTTWVFVTNAFVTSLTPKIFTSSDTEKFNVSSHLTRGILLLGVIYFLLFYFFGKSVVNLLYGEKYIQCYPLVLILIVSSIFSSMGSAFARLIYSYNGYSFEAKKTIVTALITVILSYFFVRHYGLLGAAFSTLISEFLSLTILNYFFKKFPIFKVQIYAILNLKV